MHPRSFPCEGRRHLMSPSELPLSEPKIAPGEPAAIEVRNLRFRYSDRNEALRGVTFQVGRGECVALIGPNGAGKSTLLLHLNGILPDSLPERPAVIVGGMPVSKGNLGEIRRRVGFLFQQSDDQLFCTTVREDVAFGPEQLGLSREEVEGRVRNALAEVGLSEFGERQPHHLSMGEKRRVCLAGVIACEPDVLVLDEPTGNLDPRGRREFKALLERIPATKLIATHDLELVVELCPRVIVLDHGTVVADGPTVPILSNEPFMLEHGLEKPHILLHRHPHI